MKAIVIAEPGGPGVLKLSEQPISEPSENEIRIRVKAAGVNRPDIIQRIGNYPAPPGAPEHIPGLEVAGIVDKTGTSVKRWKKGDRVCALVAGGGYAEYVNAPEGQCLPVPDGLDFVEAASLPETYFTVWSNVFDRGNFSRGERVLIHGGTSGIGVAAIQMITQSKGEAVVTAGTREKCRFCEDLGAVRAINYREEDFEKIIREELGGVDIILDMVGGDYTPKNLQCLKVEGRLLIINAMKGRESPVDLMRIMVRRLTITGSTLRARETAFKASIAAELEKNIWPLLSTRAIRPVVYKTFPLSDAKAAHELMESSRHIGKIILTN